VIINSLAAVVPRRKKNVSMILEMTRDGKTVHVGEACIDLHESTCISFLYKPKLTLTRVQLRTAVHILVRRVQQLSKVIAEADREVPPLNPEDDEFLDRVVGTLGLSDAPPYESSAVKDIKIPNRQVPKQQTFTPETSHSPSVGLPISIEDSTTPRSIVPDATTADTQAQQSALNDVAETMAGMHNTVTTQSPGSNMVLGAEYISPDWPFPTLDNMLNFDLFDPTDLSLHFLNEPQSNIQLPPTMQQDPAPVLQVERMSHRQEDNTSNSGDEENTELVDQLSARLGSLRLAPDGKLRYFGTGTNLHLMDNQNKSGENFMLRTPSRVDVHRLLEVADLSQVVDVQLEAHLLRLFFTWHNPSSYVVDEEVFYMARQSWFNTGVQNSYYNDVLKDSM
jgi:hypothetical protein